MFKATFCIVCSLSASFLFSSGKDSTYSLEYKIALVHHKAPSLSTSFPIEARQNSPVRGIGSTGNKVTISPCSSSWGTHMKIKLHICYIHAVGLSIALVCSLVGGSVSGNPQGSTLGDSVGLLVESLCPRGSSVLPPTLPQDFLSWT